MEHSVDAIIESWLRDLAETSRTVYRGALNCLARHTDKSVQESVALLLSDRKRAHDIVTRFRDTMAEKLAPATVNIRIYALRSLIHHARTLEVIEWPLDVTGVPMLEGQDIPGASSRSLEEICTRPARAHKMTPDEALQYAYDVGCFMVSLPALMAHARHTTLRSTLIYIDTDEIESAGVRDVVNFLRAAINVAKDRASIPDLEAAVARLMVARRSLASEAMSDPNDEGQQ